MVSIGKENVSAGLFGKPFVVSEFVTSVIRDGMGRGCILCNGMVRIVSELDRVVAQDEVKATLAAGPIDVSGNPVACIQPDDGIAFQIAQAGAFVDNAWPVMNRRQVRLPGLNAGIRAAFVAVRVAAVAQLFHQGCLIWCGIDVVIDSVRVYDGVMVASEVAGDLLRRPLVFSQALPDVLLQPTARTMHETGTLRIGSPSSHGGSFVRFMRHIVAVVLTNCQYTLAIRSGSFVFVLGYPPATIVTTVRIQDRRMGWYC